MKKQMLLSLLAVSVCTLFSCKKMVDGLNEDPNNPTSAPFSNILTGAEVGNIILQTGATARRAGIFCGYYTGIQRQHKGYNDYTVTNGDFDNLWDDAFVNTLRNAKVAEEAATAAGLDGISIGITQMIQAMTFGATASLYGDIPFDEAAQIEIENPQFESQVQVYGKIQILLDEAIQNLQKGTGRPAGGADIYFDGAPQPWIEVAYTLKARYFMHTGEYDKAYQAAGNGIQSLANSMYAPHGTGADDANLNYQLFEVETRSADLITSDFMASFVAPDPNTSPDYSHYRGNAKTNESARYEFYFQKDNVGIQPNTTDGWAAIDAPAPIVTYQENLLILAEAGFRTQGFAAGLTHLNDFRAFMSSGGYMRNVNPGDILYEAYTISDFEIGGIENMDGISTNDALLREILEERYVTLFGQIEGFNDMRRTEDETIVRVRVTPNTGNQLPQRFLYPQSEIDRNSNMPKPIPGFFDPTFVNQ